MQKGKSEKSLFIGNFSAVLYILVLINRYCLKTTKAIPQNRQVGDGFCFSVLTIIQQAVQVFPLQEYRWQELQLWALQLSVLLLWVLPWQAQWL